MTEIANIFTKEILEIQTEEDYGITTSTGILFLALSAFEVINFDEFDENCIFPIQFNFIKSDNQITLQNFFSSSVRSTVHYLDCYNCSKLYQLCFQKLEYKNLWDELVQFLTIQMQQHSTVQQLNNSEPFYIQIALLLPSFASKYKSQIENWKRTILYSSTKQESISTVSNPGEKIKEEAMIWREPISTLQEFIKSQRNETKKTRYECEYVEQRILMNEDGVHVRCVVAPSSNHQLPTLLVPHSHLVLKEAIYRPEKTTETKYWDKLAREVQIHYCFTSPHKHHICELVDWYINDRGNYVLVYPYYQGANYLPFEEGDLKLYLKQLLQALQYMHSLNMIHNNIKPQNICFDVKSKELYLIDFDHSINLDHTPPKKDEDGTEKRPLNGNWFFMSPEKLYQEYGVKSDIWSVGLILAQAMLKSEDPLIGFTNSFYDDLEPFMDDIFEHGHNLLEVIMEKFSWQKNALQFDPIAKDLLFHLLEIYEEDRYTATQALEHSFFN